MPDPAVWLENERDLVVNNSIDPTPNPDDGVERKVDVVSMNPVTGAETTVTYLKVTKLNFIKSENAYSIFHTPAGATSEEVIWISREFVVSVRQYC